jgi:hypothetical protein
VEGLTDREKLLVIACLKEFQSWVEEYRGEPEGLRDYLLERLKNINVDSWVEEFLSEIFYQAVQERL